MRFQYRASKRTLQSGLFLLCLLFSLFANSATPVVPEQGQQEVILDVRNMT